MGREWLGPPGRNHRPKTQLQESVLPPRPAIPVGVFPSVQNRNALKMHGLRSAPGRSVFPQ